MSSIPSTPPPDGGRAPRRLPRRAVAALAGLTLTVATLALATASVSAIVLQGDYYVPVAPSRVLDTRTTDQTLGAGQSLTLNVVTAASLPTTTTAVSLNVTVTDTTAASFLTVFPAGTTQPTVSNLDWTSGETVANAVMVAVPTSGTDVGELTFVNDVGSADVVVDLGGYFVPRLVTGPMTASASCTGCVPSMYVPDVPTRLADTRSGSGFQAAGETLAPGATLNLQVGGTFAVLAEADAAVLNITVTDTTAAGFLSVWPSDQTRPTTSSLNWTAGETVANRVVVDLGTSGGISLYNSGGSTDVVVDADGFFIPATAAVIPMDASVFFPAATPDRPYDTRTPDNGGAPLGPGGTVDIQLGEATWTALVINVTATDTTAASYFTVYPGFTTLPTASDVNWSAGETAANLTIAALGSSNGSPPFLDVYNDQGSADLVIDFFGYFAVLPPPV